MEEAEKLCGCRPWDYPTTVNQSKVRASRICDFYGNSCFNSVLENGLAQICQTMCVAGCNELKYTISMEKESIVGQANHVGKREIL